MTRTISLGKYSWQMWTTCFHPPLFVSVNICSSFSALKLSCNDKRSLVFSPRWKEKLRTGTDDIRGHSCHCKLIFSEISENLNVMQQLQRITNAGQMSGLFFFLQWASLSNHHLQMTLYLSSLWMGSGLCKREFEIFSNTNNIYSVLSISQCGTKLPDSLLIPQ